VDDALPAERLVVEPESVRPLTVADVKLADVVQREGRPDRRGPTRS
jgi:hypothetical protein